MDTVQKALRAVGEALGLHLDPESGKVLITGGMDVIGHRVAMQLINAGYPDLRVVSHNPDDLKDMDTMGAEVQDFSWEHEDTYAKALKDVKSVLLVIPYQKNWNTHFPAFLEACKKAKVKHIVKLSFYHSTIPGDAFQEIPLVKQHGEADEMLMKMVQHEGEINAMHYTILHATHFMSNPFIFQGEELRDTESLSTFYGASGNRGVNYVSPNDIAEAAVRVLLEPRAHYNKEYTLTGPGPVTDQQVADLLSKYLKKPVMYVDQPLHVFENGIKVSGDPNWMVEDLVALEKIKASGTEDNHAFVSGDFEKLCGHPPETYEGYLRMTNVMTPVETGAPSEIVKPLEGTITA